MKIQLNRNASRRWIHCIVLANLAVVVAASVAACRRTVTFGPATPPAAVDFSSIYDYGQIARNVVQSDQQLQATYGSKLLVAKDVPAVDSRFFILEKDKNTLILSIRGTSNLRNVLTDADYVPHTTHEGTKLQLHKGFKSVADAIYGELMPIVKPYFDQGYRMEITGHSLGGAAAAILLIYLQEEGYAIPRVTTFGQPKVTDEAGAATLAALPLVRIMDDLDPIPRLAPRFLPGSIKGGYTHFGDGVLLLDGQYYTITDERDESEDRDFTLWQNLTDADLDDHFMDHYFSRLTPKLQSAVYVTPDQQAAHRSE